MVFDLGGGTFDVSILDINNEVIEVLATAATIVWAATTLTTAWPTIWWRNTQQRREHIDLTRDPTAMSRIREAAEKAKIELSAATTASINLPFLTSDKTGPKHLERLSRAPSSTN